MDPNGTADLAFVNGRVYTMDAARRWAGAVAVSQGQIVAVGTDADVRELIGPGTERRGSRRQDAPARVPGRARPPTVERLRDAALQPVRGVLRRRVRTHRARVRGGASRRRVDRGRRLVDGRVPGREPAEGDPGSCRARPTGAAVESRRPQRVGELARARDRGGDPGHAGPGRRVDRARRGRGAGRNPPRGRLRPGREACPRALAEDRIDGLRTAQTYLHSLGITAWQDAIVGGTIRRSTPTCRSRVRGAHRAGRRSPVVGPAPRHRAGRGSDRARERGRRAGSARRP